MSLEGATTKRSQASKDYSEDTQFLTKRSLLNRTVGRGMSGSPNPSIRIYALNHTEIPNMVEGIFLN